VIALVIYALVAAAAVYLAASAVGWLRAFADAPSWSGLLRGGLNVALFLWFLYWARDNTWSIPDDGRMGIDGRIYFRAAQAWLAGGDPWLAGVAINGFRFDFAGPPPTVLVFAPFALLQEDWFNVLWLGLGLGAALYTLHRLRLPFWWLAFPPLAQAVMVGNPQVVCMAVLVSGSDWLRALAVPFKAYAALPMLAEMRWRAIAILATACAVSVLLWSGTWLTYLGEFSAISSRLAAESFGGFSATRDPRLLAITALAVVALAAVDLRAAGWLAVPALWPASQFFYSEFALPVITPLFAAVLAAGGHPADAVAPWAVVAYSAWRVGRHIQARAPSLLAMTRGSPPRAAVASLADPRTGTNPALDPQPRVRTQPPRGTGFPRQASTTRTDQDEDHERPT